MLVVAFWVTVYQRARLVQDDFHLLGDGSWDLRVYALGVLVLMLILVFVGVSWVVKVWKS